MVRCNCKSTLCAILSILRHVPSKRRLQKVLRRALSGIHKAQGRQPWLSSISAIWPIISQNRELSPSFTLSWIVWISQIKPLKNLPNEGSRLSVSTALKSSIKNKMAMMSLWSISRSSRIIQTWLTALVMTSIVKISTLSMKPIALIMNAVPTYQISIRQTPMQSRLLWLGPHWLPIRKMARPRKIMRPHVIFLGTISTNTTTTSLSMMALPYVWCEKISRLLIKTISDPSMKRSNVEACPRRISLLTLVM